MKPGTAKNKLFPGYATNFRYIGEVKNGLDRVTVVTSIPIPKYSDIEKRPIIFNNCTKDLWRQGARTKGQPQYETYTKCNRVLAQAKFYQNQQEELQFLLRQLLTQEFPYFDITRVSNFTICLRSRMSPHVINFGSGLMVL